MSHSLPIDLEGSVLAHTFYMLRRAGVAVRPVDLEEPPGLSDTRLFDKLVRDQVPQMIAQSGEQALTRHARSDELVPLLRQKAVEEALELYSGETDDAVLQEAGDLLEVIRAIALVLGHSLEDVVRIAEVKREERGGFDAGVVLRGTYVPPLSVPSTTGRLFAIEADPALGHDPESSIRFKVEGDSLKLWVNPIPPVHLPVQVTERVPGLAFAIEARRDRDGISLLLIPLTTEVDPNQGRLFDG